VNLETDIMSGECQQEEMKNLYYDCDLDPGEFARLYGAHLRMVVYLRMVIRLRMVYYGHGMSGIPGLQESVRGTLPRNLKIPWLASAMVSAVEESYHC